MNKRSIRTLGTPTSRAFLSTSANCELLSGLLEPPALALQSNTHPTPNIPVRRQMGGVVHRNKGLFPVVVALYRVHLTSKWV
jgi:hypothetical protein